MQVMLDDSLACYITEGELCCAIMCTEMANEMIVCPVTRYQFEW